MLIAPMIAAPPKTTPGVITSPVASDPDTLPTWPNRSFRVSKTPSALRTPYRTPTATIQMKNSAIDSTSEIFSADQVSMCRSWRRARRGPRPLALAALRPRRPVLSLGSAAWAAEVSATNDPPVGAAGADPVTGGTGGPETGGTVADPVCARCVPVVGIAWVEET